MKHRQIGKKLERTATSKQECDLVAAHILNRLEVDTRVASTAHANPGIASIWKDERIRRDRMPCTGDFAAPPPPLEIPPVEDRPLAQTSESNSFHLEALRTKLAHLRASASNGSCNESSLMLDMTLNATAATGIAEPNQSRFNLKRLLTNAVYPAECSQQQSGNILNASCVLDHHSFASNRSKVSGRRSQQQQQSDWSSTNDVTVDEDLVLSLSQTGTLDVTRKYLVCIRLINNCVKHSFCTHSKCRRIRFAGRHERTRRSCEQQRRPTIAN